MGIGFKPRFVLRDGQLELVPMPVFRSVEAISTLGRDSRALEHEFFYPGGPSGQVRAAFPYIASLAAFAFSWRVRAQMAGVPPYAPFYHPEHPSGALQVTAAIIAAFDREARERAQSPLVLYQSNGRPIDQGSMELPAIFIRVAHPEGRTSRLSNSLIRLRQRCETRQRAPSLGALCFPEVLGVYRLTMS